MIDNKKYGVLVSQSKYSRFYKMANSTFKKDLANLQDELLQAFINYPELKEQFLSGQSITL